MILFRSQRKPAVLPFPWAKKSWGKIHVEEMVWNLLEVEHPCVKGHLLLGFVDYYFQLHSLLMDHDILVEERLAGQLLVLLKDVLSKKCNFIHLIA